MVNEEKDALLATLNAQREHLLSTLDGLSGEDLRRPVLPSAWTPLGMIRHLALEVEQLRPVARPYPVNHVRATPAVQSVLAVLSGCGAVLAC
jgi:hypothetical protein